MGHAIHDLNLWKIEGADALDTGDVDAELVGVRAALMMGVDAAGLAEIVFRRAGVELVERQIVFALNELDIRKLRRHRGRTAHPAIGTGAAPDRIELVRQPKPEPDGAAMAGRIVLLSFVAHELRAFSSASEFRCRL
jgi:hypothetical protein